MILTVEEAKNWLKDIPPEEDLIIGTLISAAETYLYNATGNVFDETNDLARLFCLVLVTDWYENREYTGRVTVRTRPIVQSILVQLRHCYEPPIDEGVV